ncbi:MAG: VWA domain-containing protein [Desulfurococcales archaeon]|nr:VWA domain-containing protein [Desulfurococcales archaeon]
MYSIPLIILFLATLTPLAATSSQAAVTPQCPSQCPLDIAFVLDTSGSMAGTRLDNLKDAVQTFVNLTCDDGARWIGLVWFNTTSDFLTPSLVPVDDPGDRDYLNSLVDTLTAGGLTNMGDGIYNGINLLINTGRPLVPDVMIIVSDGEPTSGPDAANAASVAKSQGIFIVGVFIGTPGIGDEFLANISDYFINGSEPGFNITEAFINLSTTLCPIVERVYTPPLVGGEASLVTSTNIPWIALAGATLILAGALAVRRRASA